MGLQYIHWVLAVQNIGCLVNTGTLLQCLLLVDKSKNCCKKNTIRNYLPPSGGKHKVGTASGQRLIDCALILLGAKCREQTR